MNEKLKCYISSNSNSDLSRITNILSNLDVEVQSFYDFSIGSSFSDLIKRKIKETDFVIALLSDNSDNVLFELGVAEALGKPTFILIQTDKKIPLFIEGKMYFRLDWSKNTHLLELSLKNYILDISNRSTRNKKKKNIIEKSILTINETNNKLINIKQLRSKDFKEIDLIEIVMDVLKKINIQAVSEMKLNDRSRVDIAITSESLSSFFGNPLLIEIKSGNISLAVIERAQYQLLDYIHKTDANFGILLYFDKRGKRFQHQFNRFPNIFLFDVEDFIKGVSSFGFEKFLIDTRNKLYHGLDIDIIV